MGYLGKEPRKDGGSLTLGATLDVNGNEVVLDADADTSITADTDDQIDIKIGGTDEVTLSSSGIVINEGSNNRDFRIESNGKANMFFVDGGDDSVVIGHNAKITAVGSLDANLQLVSGDAQPSLDIVCFSDNANHRGQVTFSKSASDTIGTGAAVGTSDLIGDIVWGAHDGTDFANEVAFIRGSIDSAGVGANDTGGKLQFGTSPDGDNSGQARMVITNEGNVFTGSLNNVFSGDDRYGANFFTSGENSFSSNVANTIYVNRDNNDGDLMQFHRARSQVGNISVSSGTVSYNAFTGSHWSRLTDNSKPTILQGTVVETIDEMCDWYQVEFTVTEKNEDGEDVDVVKKHSITLPNGKKEGDTISYTVPEGSPALIDKNDVGKTYSGKLIKEDDFKHVKCKISDTADCTNVYGVFSNWDDDDDTVNDMYVNAVGTSVVRIHKDQTVSKGDLLTSNGDGTAKKQDDDIIRSKTIGKVLTNIKQETYSDGSYTVPCALYCG